MKKLNFLLLALASAFMSQAQKSDYKVIKSFPIHSDGRWDYIAVSPVSNSIYVSHGTQVNVLDKTTGDSITVFKGTKGVHGITFAKEYNKGFISNGKLDNLFVFDAQTNKITATIPVGKKPDAMLYDHFSKKLIVGNGNSEDASIVDVASNKVIATIALGGAPEESVSDNKGKIYINLEDKNEIVVLDIKALKVIGRYQLTGGDAPTGLAMDHKKGILFSTCANKKIFILQANTGKILQVLPIGANCDGAAFDPKSGNAFAACGDGVLTVVHQDKSGKYRVLQNVKTMLSARTIALDETTGWIYLPAAEMTPNTNPKMRPTMKNGSFRVLVVAH